MSARNPKPNLGQHQEPSSPNKNNFPNRGNDSGNTTNILNGESDIMETTRRYPRTLQEAFPNKAEQAEWFYKPNKEVGIIGAFLWTMAVLFVIGFLLIFFE